MADAGTGAAVSGAAKPERAARRVSQRFWQLAGSARNPGLSRVVTNLVTHPEDQEFYRIDVPDDLVGQPVSAALVALKERYDALLVGIVRGMDDYVLNPPMDRALARDERLLVISSYSIDAVTTY